MSQDGRYVGSGREHSRQVQRVSKSVEIRGRWCIPGDAPVVAGHVRELELEFAGKENRSISPATPHPTGLGPSE